MRRLGTAIALAATVLAGGCDTWFGESEAPPLPGNRISVLEHQRTLTPDPQARTESIALPVAVRNPDWTQAGGDPTHAMQNLEAGDIAKPIWEARIGAGTTASRPALAPPVIAGGRVFAIDTRSVVSAFDAASGDRLWRTDLSEDEDDDTPPGGIAWDGGRLFATTGFGRVVALDAGTGEEQWRRNVGLPMRAPPTAAGGRVFVVTVENQLRALDAVSGRDAWPPHQALAEGARILGGASPAVAGSLVVAPFSSGELVALRADNGRALWTDSLAPARRTDELSALAQIRARPVVDGTRVYAISAGGILAAFDVRTGQRLWDRDIGGLQSPWVAGRHLYQITVDGQLVALSAETGRIHWVTQLPTWGDEKERRDPILWSGPVLLRDRLFIVSNTGRMGAVSPFDGKIIDQRGFGEGASLAPVVADGTVFMLFDDGTLAAFR